MVRAILRLSAYVTWTLSRKFKYEVTLMQNVSYCLWTHLNLCLCHLFWLQCKNVKESLLPLTDAVRIWRKSIDHSKYGVFNLKVDRILIWVIYLLRFTTYYITQLTCIYSKCWKWSPFISMHLSTCFTMFLATFLSVLSFFNNFRNSTFYWRLPSKFFKETLSAVGVRHRF